MLKKLFGLFAVLASNVVFADCGSNYCGFVKITEMHVVYDGTVWIATSGNEANITNCTPQSSLFIKVDTTTVGGKNIYSALLSAQARDKNVQVRTMDNVSPCQVHYVVVE
jgi:hypothetical protein